VSKSSPTPPLLTIRTAVILLLALVCASVAAALTYLAHNPIPTAALAGFAAASGAIAFLHKAIG
jgi:hypothetical protein